MSATVRTVTTFYVTAGVWLVVMLATVAALLGPMNVFEPAFQAPPEVRAIAIMSIAILAATGVAAVVWRRIRGTAPVGAVRAPRAVGPTRDRSSRTGVPTA